MARMSKSPRAMRRSANIVCRAEVTGLPSPSKRSVPGGWPADLCRWQPSSMARMSAVRPVRSPSRNRRWQLCAAQTCWASSRAPRSISPLLTSTRARRSSKQQFSWRFWPAISEHLFELPGGPIVFAAGFEWRRDESQFRRDSFEIDRRPRGRKTSQRRCSIRRSMAKASAFTKSSAKFVSRFLGDMPFVDNLEVTAGRSLFGLQHDRFDRDLLLRRAVTSPVDWLTFRGTYSRAIRAPNSR